MVTYDLPTQMSQILTAPQRGTVELDIDANDDRFDTLNDAIAKCTEFYSEAQSIVGKVGLPFPGPQVQPTDAVELFVEPFSGDWNAILACGDAVNKAGQGLRAVSENLLAGMAQLFAGSGGEWEGESALAFQAHMGIHVAVYQGAGLVVSQGELVFKGISEVAQFVAGLVVELIDTALDIAVWLLEKIARYGKPWIGWVQLGWDVVTDGWEAIQSIIDTMWSLFETIQAVFELHDAVTSWVETIPAELEVFQELIAVFEQIPDLTETPILTAAQIRNDLRGVSSSHDELVQQRRDSEQQASEALAELEELEMGIEEPGVSPEISDVEVPEVEEP